MFSIPYIAAPISSASSPSRLRSRQASCMIGSAPTWRRAIDTASGEQWACAAGLSVALKASTNGAHRLELALDLGVAAAVDTGISAVTTNSPAAQLVLKVRHRPARGVAHPAGTCRSRPLNRLSHADVPFRRLSTGGRTLSMWPRQSGRRSERS